MKHVYVLGSNSFSGAHFVQHALEQGYQVTGVSRTANYPKVFLPYLDKNHTLPKNFSFLQADFNYDMEAIIKSIKKDKPSFVVNFAAQGMVAESWNTPAQWFSTNTLAPLALYDALRNLDGFEKFVQISTPEVYGSTSGLVKESVHYQPSTPYAVSKAAADMNLLAYHKAYGFPVTFTRAANVYGACQQLYRIIPKCVLYFLMGKSLKLHGGGHSTRAFIHIKDVAMGTCAIMEKANPPNIFHISPVSGNQIAIKDLVQKIALQMNVDPEKYIEKADERLGKDIAYGLDVSKLHHELHWKDNISLEQGIEEVIQWTKDNFTTLSTLPTEYIHKA